MSVELKLAALAERWAGAAPAERANASLYIGELCDAIEVEKPRPAGGGYQFEYPVRVVNRDGTETTNFVDLFKRNHFILEAKDQGTSGTDTILLRKAYGQARAYAGAADGGPPPYLLVLDVGRSLLVWDRWSGAYGGFNAATRLNLPGLADNTDAVALLRDVFENPQARNPNTVAAAVTKDIAVQLANLAASLEERGYEQERIARFLIRCVFTMFAEDTGLIPDAPFTRAIDEIGFTNPEEFSVALAELWRAMDEGSRFGLKKFLRFNGHFFHDQEVLPLTKQDLIVLRLAAESNWALVEPSIMGTLLVRALDPEERHRLGAEFTPREFVERVVRPTVEEPIRERWTAVQAEVLQLRDPAGKTPRTRRDHEKQALERLRGFHAWLRELSFLDPACGSGNFLYVTLSIVKQVELEVLRAVEEITRMPELSVEEVGPWQFHGLEVKHWAREIAELSLWIGYHQWWRRTHGHTQPPEPVLRDTGTLECRDAVLAWDSIREDPARSAADPASRLIHPVTGERVPDPNARIPYYEHVNARQSEWPSADFVVGNPPYLGKSVMAAALGSGYVDALRSVYAEVADGADYVMYWWHRAAQLVAAGTTIRAGLITTNSIRQAINRSVVRTAQENGVSVIYAIPDHPWVDDVGAADVTVSITVLAADSGHAARRAEVDSQGQVVAEITAQRLNADLSAHVDVATASEAPLRANQGLAANGFLVYGRGFVLTREEAQRLIDGDPRNGHVIRPLRNGRDLNARSRDLFVIDFGLRGEPEARQYPALYDIVRSRVKPYRDTVNDAGRREKWWLFGRTNEALRAALQGIPRYLGTSYVSKHRIFTFLDTRIAAEDTVVCVALADDFSHGVLSSRIHATWALAAGSRLGVGNDPRYNKTKCFDAFPFPTVNSDLRTKIGEAAAAIEEHRRAASGRDARNTLTAQHNVVEKLRSGEELTPAERRVHDSAACGVLRDLLDQLDSLVAEAYGLTWPLGSDAILAKLVELHNERRAAEMGGTVQWLRQEYQAARFSTGDQTTLQDAIELEDEVSHEAVQWPSTVIEQIRALQGLLARGPVNVQSAAAQFRGARRDLVARHLEILAVMGELHVDPDGTYSPVAAPA